MDRIYLCDIRELLNLEGAELLTQARRERMTRFLRREDQARCLAAGLLLRRGLGKENAQKVTLTPFGKPYLREGPSFNLSHSGNKVVLLVGERDAGVDVEQIAPYHPAVARKVFTAREQDWLKNQRETSAFYRLWTGKESVMKALGLGFRLPPESFEISPEELVSNLVLGKTWFLRWQEIDGHMLCSASCSADINPELIFLTKEELLQF